MANVKLVRVDFRLIHGQVIAKWLKQLQANRIIVIDNNIPGNPLLCKVYRMAAPAGVKVQIADVKSAAGAWNRDKFGEGDVLVLFKDIGTALSAWKEGFGFERIQIGGAGGGPGQKAVHKNINLSQEDYNGLMDLYDHNVDVFMQAIPEEKPVNFSEIIKKKIF